MKDKKKGFIFVVCFIVQNMNVITFNFPCYSRGSNLDVMRTIHSPLEAYALSNNHNKNHEKILTKFYVGATSAVFTSRTHVCTSKMQKNKNEEY